jgi:hypothetical protein
LGSDAEGISQVSTALGFVRLEMLMRGEQVMNDRRHPFTGSARARGTPDRWSPGPPAIITGAPLGISQDSIGLVEATEAGFSIGIIRVQIRVETRG